MGEIGRIRNTHLVLLLGVLLALVSVAAVSATGASAGPLEGVTGPAKEVVAPIKEVTETVTAPAIVPPVAEPVTQPVHEATETVAPPVHEAIRPVHEATEAVTPPVQEAAETVTRPASGVTEKVKPPVQQVPPGKVTEPVKGTVGKATSTAQSPADTSGSISAGASKGAGTAVRESTGTAAHTVQGTAGAATDSSASGSSSADQASGHRGASTDALAPYGPRGSTSDSAAPDLGPGDDTFEVPSPDGSVRAPFRKLLAYVWPAIALTGPALGDLLEEWGQQSLRLALGTGPTGASSTGEGRNMGPVVAGVHAAGGRPEPSDSSSSPFYMRLPAALDHSLNPGLPTNVWTLLCLLAIAGLGVYAGVRWEIVAGRRGRREG